MAVAARPFRSVLNGLLWVAASGVVVGDGKRSRALVAEGVSVGGNGVSAGKVDGVSDGVNEGDVDSTGVGDSTGEAEADGDGVVAGVAVTRGEGEAFGRGDALVRGDGVGLRFFVAFFFFFGVGAGVGVANKKRFTLLNNELLSAPRTSAQMPKASISKRRNRNFALILPISD